MDIYCRVHETLARGLSIKLLQRGFGLAETVLPHRSSLQRGRLYLAIDLDGQTAANGQRSQAGLRA
jgi:hypothetical protein